MILLAHQGTPAHDATAGAGPGRLCSFGSGP